MIHRLLWMAFLCLSLVGSAQNLIPNPSFEDTLCIENPSDQLYIALDGWFNANGATPDRYTAAQDSIPCFFNSIYDPAFAAVGEWQFPKDGQQMIGLWCGNELNISRDLVEARLLEPLMADTTYCFSMYVSLGNRQNLAIDRIGAFFSMDSVYDPDWAGGYNLPMHIVNPEGEFLTDTMEWMLVQGSYTASGGESFVIIGNAFDDSQTNYLEVDGSGNGWDVAKYFVDDLNLEPCSQVGLFESMDIEPSAYYSSLQDAIIIDTRYPMNWELYDLRGRRLYVGRSELGRELIQMSGIVDGIYILRWQNGRAEGSLKVFKASSE